MARNKVIKSRKDIIGISFDIINTEGVVALSARRLAKELDVSFMTIYNYVENIDEIKKEAILNGFRILNENIYESVVKDNIDLNELNISDYCKTIANEIFKFSLKYNGIYQLMFTSDESRFYNDPEIAPFYRYYTQLLDVRSNKHKYKKELHMLDLIIHGLIREKMLGINDYSKDEYNYYIDKFIEKIIN